MIEFGNAYYDNKATRIIKNSIPRGAITHKERVPAFTNNDTTRNPIGWAKVVAPVNHPNDYYITVYLSDDDPRVEQIITPIELVYDGEHVFINYIGSRDDIKW